MKKKKRERLNRENLFLDIDLASIVSFTDVFQLIAISWIFQIALFQNLLYEY